jgi:hypothetical protein
MTLLDSKETRQEKKEIVGADGAISVSTVGRTNTDAPDRSFRPESARRRVVGVDIWVECPSGTNHVIDQARKSAAGTHLRLTAALEGIGIRGMSRGNEHASLRLRFVTRQDDSHITDEAVFELLARLPGQLHWSDLVKLEEFDGIPAYAPLPFLH